MAVLLGRAFLLIIGRQVNFEVIVGAVKKDMIQVSLIILPVAMVKEFHIFLVRFPNEGAAVINLVL